MNGKIYRACLQSVLTYGNKTWAMQVANLQSFEREERMMVNWISGVSLKDRKHCVDLYSLLGIHSVEDVVRHSRLKWLDRESLDDWVSGCGIVEMWRWQGWDVKGGEKVWRMTCHPSHLLSSLYISPLSPPHFYRPTAWFAARLGSIQKYVEGLHIGKCLTLA